MAIPFSLSGRVAARDVTDQMRAVSGIVRALEVAAAGDIQRLGNRVSFKGGLARVVSSWNILVPIGSGEVNVRASEEGVIADYTLHFTQILGVVTTLVAGMVLLVLLMARDWPTALAIGVSAWLWLYGANVLLTSFRFPRWLRRALTREDMRS